MCCEIFFFLVCKCKSLHQTSHSTDNMNINNFNRISMMLLPSETSLDGHVK